MNYPKIVGAALALACACAVGCRTTKDVLDDYETSLSTGQYVDPVQETSELADKKDGTQLLWQLMAGGSLYMAGDRNKAIEMFDHAEDTMSANDRVSVFSRAGDGALAMLTNDRSFPYDGGGQDRIFTCLYKAIDYMAGGRRDAARTELNRAAQHQENWLWQRRKDVAAAARRLEADAAAYAKQQPVQLPAGRTQQTASVLANPSFRANVRSKCRFDPMTSGNLNRLAPYEFMNAYASHVTGVFRWLVGDSARNCLKDAAALQSGNRVLQRDYAEVNRGVKPVNQVWIYAEDGLCQCREEWRLDLPLALLPFVQRYVLYAGMALPYLRERSHGAINWSVVANGAAMPMAQLADVDALVKTEYNVYMRGALTREITRTIIKIGAQVALGAAAEAAEKRHEKKKKNSSSNDFWTLKAAQIGVATWAASTTAADLRSWTALPKTVKVARVARPADGKIEIVADGQRIPLVVPPGNTMVFIRKPGPAACPMVKMATF